jgi:hypothetical protein
MGNDTSRTRHRKREAKAMQRVADAYAMRIRGADWATIAHTVGYANPQNAMRAVRNYTGGLPELAPEELRSMWRDRLEYLWPLALRDVENSRPGATRAAVAIAQRAAQLDGLDAPQQVEISPGEETLDRLIATMLKRAGHEEIIDADVIEWDVAPAEPTAAEIAYRETLAIEGD